MSDRVKRFERALQEIIAPMFVGERLRDPRLKGVTVCGVQASKDLQSACIRYFAPDDVETSFVEAVLNRTKPYIRKSLAEELRARVIPSIRFSRDQSVKQFEEVERLLRMAFSN